MVARASWWTWVGIGLALGVVGPAHAQEAIDGIENPRAVGRAGTSTVSGDSGMALMNNPAGMVRRSGKRLLLSASLRDSDTSFESAGATDSPVLVNRAADGTAPLAAYHQGNEEGTWVLGALVVGQRAELSLPTPAFGQPADDVARLFPHRYAGTQWERESRRFAMGGALRIGESLGIGASVSLGQLHLRESRQVWAGFAGRDTLLDSDLDMALQLTGEDLYNPGASLGLFVAPPELPLEFAFAAEFRRGQHYRQGPLALEATSSGSAPQSRFRNASASLRLPSTLDLRSGIRYLGELVFVELGAELHYVRNEEARYWSLQGVQVIDQSGLEVDFTRVNALVSERTHLALRGAIDYEALAGFLWITGGYAYQSPAAKRSQQNPGYARLGGHTLAAGLEAAYEDFIISLGYARHLERTRRVTGSSLPVVNPFGAGSAPANQGRYRQSSDQVGFAVELSWQ